MSASMGFSLPVIPLLILLLLLLPSVTVPELLQSSLEHQEQEVSTAFRREVIQGVQEYCTDAMADTDECKDVHMESQDPEEESQQPLPIEDSQGPQEDGHQLATSSQPEGTEGADNSQMDEEATTTGKGVTEGADNSQMEEGATTTGKEGSEEGESQGVMEVESAQGAQDSEPVQVEGKAGEAEEESKKEPTGEEDQGEKGEQQQEKKLDKEEEEGEKKEGKKGDKEGKGEEEGRKERESEAAGDSSKSKPQAKAKAAEAKSVSAKHKSPGKGHFDFPTTLEGFGYAFNEKGQLRSIESGEPFVFVVQEDDKEYNQAHYEALGEVITEVIYGLLESELNLKRITLPTKPKKNEPISFFFASEDAFTNSEKLMVLIHGSGVVRAGQWARRLIINDCLDSGTQFPFIRRAMAEGYGVVVMNTNRNADIVAGKAVSIRVLVQETWSNIKLKKYEAQALTSSTR